MDRCPSAETLHAFIADRLVENDVISIETHVESCGTCQQALERLTSEPALLVSGQSSTGTESQSGKRRIDEFLQHVQNTLPFDAWNVNDTFVTTRQIAEEWAPAHLKLFDCGPRKRTSSCGNFRLPRPHCERADRSAPSTHVGTISNCPMHERRECRAGMTFPKRTDDSAAIPTQLQRVLNADSLSEQPADSAPRAFRDPPSQEVTRRVS
jgi:hypothetical protein